MTKTFIAAVMLGAFATPANAQVKAAVPTDEKWCNVLTVDHESASGSMTEDTWGTKIFAKLKASGCQAGDIVSFRSFGEQSTAAARFCDFTRTVYVDDRSVVCRWTGKLRPAAATIISEQ